MGRSVGAVIVCLCMLASVLAIGNAVASGTETGAFPDRTFVIDNARPWNKDGASYVSTFSPQGSGDWWVQLTELKGSYVLIQLYAGTDVHTKPLVSTDLRMPGDVSKKQFVSSEATYTVAFTCYGRKASAVLQEEFTLVVPFPCTEHSPVHIRGDAEFTSANGVVAGDGSEQSPFVISGWMIFVSETDHGIWIEWTHAHFVIRECYFYSTSESWMCGIWMSFVSNGVVEDCVMKSNSIGVIAFSSSSIEVRENVFNDCIGGACEFADCTDCSFHDNVVNVCNWGLAIEVSQRISVWANSFAEGGMIVHGIKEIHYTSHMIAPDNSVAGLPIMYITDADPVELVGGLYAQVIIAGCANIHVKDLVLTGYQPLTMAYDGNGLVEACEFSSVRFEAMYFDNCTNIVVRQNWLHDNPGGYFGLIVTENSTGMNIVDNRIERTDSEVIRIQYESVGVRIADNEFIGCAGGIGVFLTSDVVVESNTITSCGFGMFGSSSSDLQIVANSISQCGWGLYLDEVTSCRVFCNNFVDNSLQVREWDNTGVEWDDGIGTGNYWSDYNGIDVDCDGVGDVPCQVSDTSVDRYPLMRPWVGPPPGTHVERGPIVIVTDAGFTAENGVRSGSGTAGDPFIISGWLIDCSSETAGTAISISDTNAHFIIRNVETVKGGILLSSCANAVVRDNTVLASYDGIRAVQCPGIRISGNSIQGMGWYGGPCIGVYETDYARITDNTVRGGLWGIWIGGGASPLVVGNYLEGNVYGIGVHSGYSEAVMNPVVSDNMVVGGENYGIVLKNTCMNGLVSGNTVVGNGGDGIAVEQGYHTTVVGNTVMGCSGSGIAVRYLFSGDNVVVGNEIVGNGIGVSLTFTTTAVVYGNDIVDNAMQAFQDSDCYGVAWDNGLPDGGNFWSDYLGLDEDADGIGDTPYPIGSYQDRYPLMQPCVP